jgi:hypothetical protein
MPVLVPWFLLLALVANILLVGFGGESPLYFWTLCLQITFYFTAILGLLADRLNWYLPLTAIPFYFVTANLGSIFGFFAFLAGAQSAAWRKVE